MSVCLVNLAELNPESNGGLSRAAKEICKLLFDLSQERPGFYPVFVVGDRFASHFAQWIERDAVVVPIFPQHPGRPLVRGMNPDLIVSPLFGVEPFDQIQEFSHVRHIAVMPDALALDLPEFFPPKVRAQRKHSYQQLKRAYRVITLTDYARNRLIHHLQLAPESIAAIHLGADFARQDFTNTTPLALPRPYLYYPANTWLHKRHHLMMQVFKSVLQQRPDMHLVLTGGRVTDFGVDLSKLAASNDIPADHLHDLGYVSDVQMPQLYGNAEALLFTSMHEGFGLPVLEAMHYGCPVICAPVTAIPEVAGDAALYVNSDDPSEWASAILNDLPARRATLVEMGQRRAAQFSWDQTHEQYRRFFLEAAPDVFAQNAQASPPTVSLQMALQEITGWVRSAPAEAGVLQGGVVAPPEVVDINIYLQYMESLLQEEKRSVMARIPVIGLFVRSLIRLRNIGRYWRTSAPLVREIVRRQALLVAEKDANSPD